MAERRMFAKTIIDSDAFLDMPLSTQSLYFHLSMRADDDGFINNSKKIQRMIGASDDDLKILMMKNFIIPFESGVVVIKHWRIHNYIRNDRYKETVYQEEKNQLTLKENNAYTLGIPNGNQTETQYSIGKDIDSIEYNTCANTQPITTAKESKNKLDELFDKFWKEYPKKIDKAKCKKWFDKNKPNEQLVNKMIETIVRFKNYAEQWKRDNGQYIPYPLTWLNGGRWDDELTVEVRQQTPVKEEFKHQCTVIDEVSPELEEILKKYGR
jgi:hypothetical protein